MTNQVFTLGYSGRKPHQIKELIDQHDAVLFDIRFSPRSRVPYWSGSALEALLGKARYTHVKALGNENYRGGPTKLVNFEAGLETIRASAKPVILMCACKDPAHCHRTEVADMLREHGLEVAELNDPAPPARPLQSNFLTLL